MRTRFLNIDYFALPTTRAFLHLPVPPVSSPPPSTVEDHVRFHFIPNVSPHSLVLNIDEALSKFLSDVLPHRIDVDFHDFEKSVPSWTNCFSSFSAEIVESGMSEQEAETIRKMEAENCRILESQADTESAIGNKSISLSDEDKSSYRMIQFETPAMDFILENACFPEESWQNLFETLGLEDNLEMLKPELLMQYHFELLESMSFVEHVTPEYLTGQNVFPLEDNNSAESLPYSAQSKFPILEVDEESLGILPCLSMEENFGSHFDNISPLTLEEKYRTIIWGKELLGSMKNDMMVFLSEDCLSKKHLVLPDLHSEREFMILLEAKHAQENSFMPETSQANATLLENPVSYEEFLFLDEDLIKTFEFFCNTKTWDNSETSEWMLQKELNCKNFEELIVSNEIALIDETFKSLPVPVISDYGKMTPLHAIIEEMLSNLKTQPLSASDGIYLNWDLLEEDKCNFQLYHYYQNMCAKIDVNGIDYEGKSFDNGKLIFDLVFSNDALCECGMEQSEEEKLLLDYASLLDNHKIGISSGKLLDDGSPKQKCEKQLAEKDAERASLLFKSMSEVSTLDYFLNPQKVTTTTSGKRNFAVESTDADLEVPEVKCTESEELACTGQQSQRCHIVLHRVKLSDNILALIGNFEKRYLAILQSETELTKTHNSSVDYLKFMSLSKQKLMECCGNGKNVAFIVLSAIKQAAWYLCFYGLHPVGLYIAKLCQSSDYLKSKLSFLQSLIEDENRKVVNKFGTAHPSLTVFEGILTSNIKQDGQKVLIVAEEVFWWSLKSLLLSMGLTFNELNYFSSNRPCTEYAVEDMETKMKDILISDCLILSYKHISPFFPFKKFSIILEYGGPYASSRISDLLSNSDGSPHLHFLKMEMDGHAALKALCEGVEMPSNTEMLMESETHFSLIPEGSMMNQKLEKLLNICPVVQKYDIRSSTATDADCFVPSPIPAMIAENSHQSMESFHETIIVVNTQNVDKEMIASRRSAYQVILAMEKEGSQVVERDLDLPVDIIISPAICLVWYDDRNLGKMSTPGTEASSRLLLCIENIATNVLTLLSFSFGGCFLVFEGEINFLLAAMESSDGLYAAAASLGIDLQVFFSYSCELTNEIIVRCIQNATKQTRGLYPKMPDSASLAESFLMKFPSINPLTAHAILSSEATLAEFLECSHEQRIRVLEKYHVPEESIALFSAFCRYGEREDSKSIMTDCSSSVSSGPDSDRCHLYQVNFDKKRKKHIGSPQKDVMRFDELFQFEQLDQVVDGFLDSTLLKPSTPGVSRGDGRSGDSTKASFSMNDLFGQKQEFNVNTTRNPSKISWSSCDPWNSEAQIFEQLKQPYLSPKDKQMAQNDMLDAAMISKNRTSGGPSNSEKLHEDNKGEVVDLTDSPILDKTFPSVFGSMVVPSLMTETQADHRRKSKIPRKLSFDKNSHAEDSSSNIWTSLKGARGRVDSNLEPGFGIDVFPLDVQHRQDISEEGLTKATVRSLQGLPFQEEMSHLGGTPLSRALRSASPLKSSPWTIEFLNRMKEKSRLRQKSLSFEKSAQCPGYFGNISKAAKRRSPSIIEFFKYRGSRSPGNLPENKKQKQALQSSNSAKKGKWPSSLVRSVTPNDKRARKTLTLAMNQSGGQTKLVWSDGTQEPIKKLRY